MTKKTSKNKKKYKQRNDCAYIKVFENLDLYNTTENEMKQLENFEDPTVAREARELFRPIFDDIRREKQEKKTHTKIIIRKTQKSDEEGLIALSNRVQWSGFYRERMPLTKYDLEYARNRRITFVATTQSNYIIGLSTLVVEDFDDERSGTNALIMVSEAFRRKKIATRLFDAIIKWSEKQG